MTKILIDILPAKGHFHATLKLASKLKSKGFKLIYGSEIYLQNEIEKYEFEFKELPNVSVVNVNFSRRLATENNFITFFYWFLTGEKFRKKKEAVDEFNNAVKKINPDLVLLDEQVALKSLLYEALGIKTITFQTKPDTRKIQGIPPFTSYYVPKQNVLSNVYCNYLWMLKTFGYRINYGYNRIVTFGQDNFSVFKKICRKNDILIKSWIDIKRSFGIGVKHVPRLVISPAAFDFDHPEKENVFRIGPLVDIQRERKISDIRYQSLLTQLEKFKADSPGFIIYCSLGTITAAYIKEVKIFFRKIAEVAKLNIDCLFVLSTGDKFNIEELFPSPDNLFLFRSVPQVDLLKYCDIMITHGGMNSITECIYNTVPMLIYPLSLYWDQPGNSARVVYHGLGLRGKLRKDSAKEISKKLNMMKSNHDWYKKNCTVLREKLELKNNSDEIIEIFQQFTAQ